MVRIKRGTIKLKKRRTVLKMAKGYRWGRSKKEKQAREAVYHAGNHAFAHRRKKKGDFRKLFNIRINAALRQKGLSYSRFINMLTVNSVKINRKMLSTLANEYNSVFDKVIEKVNK